MSDNNKKFPHSTPAVSDLLKINSVEQPTGLASADDTPSATELPVEEFNSHGPVKQVSIPADLPIAEVSSKKPEVVVETLPISIERKIEDNSYEDVIGSEAVNINPIWKFVKTIAPYIAIFAVGIGLYIFYFSDFSFIKLFKSDKLRLEVVATGFVNKDLENLKKETASDYKNWIMQFFVDVNDESIIDMDVDVSGNGLTNFEKYLLNLNPKVYATRGSKGDGQVVLEGINPWTGLVFTDNQKILIDKYINKELISNRITAAVLTRGVTKFARYVANDSPYYIDPIRLQQIEPSQSVSGSVSTITNPITQSLPNNGAVDLRSGDKVDIKKPGLLEIPANNISVPLIWTQSVADFDIDLSRGVVHYPGTVLPGEVGTSYISGHSSGYFWDKSPYKQVFAILGQVKDGTVFTITLTQNDGRLVKYHYTVERRGEFLANDQAQFASTADSIVALSTCWPVGTTDKRLVLFAKLNQTERL